MACAGGAIDVLGAEPHLTKVELVGIGAGISLAGANGVIVRSTIRNNTASTQGGGIYFRATTAACWCRTAP